MSKNNNLENESVKAIPKELRVMQREIKFRAWESRWEEMKYTNKSEDEIILPDYGFYDTSKFLVVTHKLGGNKSDIIAIGYQHGELMQFTGLKDKNNKEIYEGDIINDDGLIMTIQFIGGGFCKCNENGDWVIGDVDNIEVVGNIFENPELVA